MTDAQSQKGFVEWDRQECETANAELQRQLDIVNAREYHTAQKLSSSREDQQALEEDLGRALDALEHNEQVLVGAEKQLEDFRAAVSVFYTGDPAMG